MHIEQTHALQTGRQRNSWYIYITNSECEVGVGRKGSSRVTLDAHTIRMGSLAWDKPTQSGTVWVNLESTHLNMDIDADRLG